MARDTAHPVIDAALSRFAARLQTDIGAQRVLLFGSRSRGAGRTWSDYEIIVVAEGFRDVPVTSRARGLRQLWYEGGGNGPMDLICVTPEEFDRASRRISLIAAVAPGAVDLFAAADAPDVRKASGAETRLG